MAINTEVSIQILYSFLIPSIENKLDDKEISFQDDNAFFRERIGSWLFFKAYLKDLTSKKSSSLSDWKFMVEI